MNRSSIAGLVVAGSLAIAGAVSPTPGMAAASQARASGAFGVTTGAYTYNQTIVPVGSAARVHAIYTASGKTIVTLHLTGLIPNREYGAHAHKFMCGADPLAAGGHFQYVQGGASDPAFANDENEIWLDFTTDDEGNASAQTALDWQFPAERRAGSVVIHDHHTDHGTPGTAGTAGSRYGCLSVAF